MDRRACWILISLAWGACDDRPPPDPAATAEAIDAAPTEATPSCDPTATLGRAVFVVPGDVAISSCSPPRQHVHLGGRFTSGDTSYGVLVWLYSGRGVFRDGLATGTYDLAAETDPNECGLCIFLGRGAGDSGETSQSYFARGGAATLTSVLGRLTGTIDNVDFAPVQHDRGSTSWHEVDTTCHLQLENGSFDAEVWDDLVDC